MISILLFYGFQLFYFIAGLARNPVFLVSGYLTVYFLYDQTRWWYKSVPHLSYSFVFSAFILFLAVISKKTKPSVFSHKPVIFMTALGIYFVLVNFWAVAPSIHTYDTENFIKLLAVMIAAIFLIKNREDVEWVIGAYTVGAAYLGYYVFQFGRTSWGRVSGVGVVDAPDVNGLASSMLIGAFFSLYFFWTKKGWRKILAVVCGAFIVNALVLMNSRGSFLGVFCGGLWFVYQMYKSNINISRKNLKITALAAAGVISLFVVLDQSAIDRIISIKADSELTTEKQTGSTRVFFWMASVDMAKDYPLGAGARSFILLSPKYIPEEVETGGSRNRAVHSTWFQALTEVGFAGTVLFLLMLICCYFSVRRIKGLISARLEQVDDFMLVVCFEAATVGYLVAITFLDRFRAVSLYFMVMLCVSMCRTLIPKKEAGD